MDGGAEMSVAGGWLGTYYYGGRLSWQEPVRFEASFDARSDGSFTGKILDDSDLGEAGVSGSQSALIVKFTKEYYRPPMWSDTAPIDYHGVLSEDGKKITGRWTMSVRRGKQRTSRLSGEGEARRMWHVDESHSEESDEEFMSAVSPATREMVGAGR